MNIEDPPARVEQYRRPLKQLYLSWLYKHERQPGENAPLGLTLCADKNQEQNELLELDQGLLLVAAYLTELPPKDVLERKLLENLEHAVSSNRRSRGEGKPR